jgi:hypothetical protein
LSAYRHVSDRVRKNARSGLEINCRLGDVHLENQRIMRFFVNMTTFPS